MYTGSADETYQFSHYKTFVRKTKTYASPENAQTLKNKLPQFTSIESHTRFPTHGDPRGLKHIWCPLEYGQFVQNTRQDKNKSLKCNHRAIKNLELMN